MAVFPHHIGIDMKIQFVHQINIFTIPFTGGGGPGPPPPLALVERKFRRFKKRTSHMRRRGRLVGLFPQESGYVQLIIIQLVT